MTAAKSWHWRCAGCDRRASTDWTAEKKKASKGPGVPLGWTYRGCSVVCAECKRQKKR